MEGYCSTGQSPQGAIVPMEKEVSNGYQFLRYRGLCEMTERVRSIGRVTLKGRN
jgi:hypothetical protein